MQIEILKKDDEEKWDNFVLSSSLLLPYHLLAWRKLIKASYGHQDLYLVAKEGGDIKGILPFFIIKHSLLGKKIVSLSFCNYGGIIADNQEIENLLLNYSKDYAKKNNYDFFELRSVSSLSNLPVNLSYFTFVLKLEKEDVLWDKLNSSVRNHIRKSNKFNLRLETGNQHLKDFYKIYQKRMKELGTPCHSFSFMENILKGLPSQTELIMVKFKDKFIAGLFLVFFKKTAFNLWGVSDLNYSRMNPNNFLYWETLKYCIKNHIEFFDFGRSQKKSGTFHFKKQWGAEPRQLYYYYYSSKKKEVFLNKNQYKIFSQIWRILPLKLANLIGPKIRKYIP